jgi:hypothetical protein
MDRRRFISIAAASSLQCWVANSMGRVPSTLLTPQVTGNQDQSASQHPLYWGHDRCWPGTQVEIFSRAGKVQVMARIEAPAGWLEIAAIESKGLSAFEVPNDLLVQLKHQLPAGDVELMLVQNESRSESLWVPFIHFGMGA